MARRPETDVKSTALRQSGTLNTHPDDVADELFRQQEFFDPRDLVQVKYEMLRRVGEDGRSVSQAAASFGFSRPSFYQAQTAFETGGLAGLVPHRRGPKQGYKLTPDIIDFLRKARHDDAEASASALAQMVEEKFGITIHARTIGRGLRRDQKKPR
jgi:transposase